MFNQKIDLLETAVESWNKRGGEWQLYSRYESQHFSGQEMHKITTGK